MSNRTSFLYAFLVLFAAVAPARAQTGAAAGTPVAADSASPASGGTTDVTVKDSGAPAQGPQSTVNHQKPSPGDVNGLPTDTLTVDFPDEDIRTIIRNVAELFDLNVVIPETLQGKTSVKLHDVTWMQIFQVVLQPVGYTFIQDGNIIKVVSNDSLQQEPASTEVFIINYAKATDIQPIVSSLIDASAGGRIVVDSRTNSLVITERPSRMARIRPIINELDKPTDQVMIESKFVEISKNDLKNLGVNWTSLSGYNVTATPGTNGIYSYSNTHGTSVGSSYGFNSVGTQESNVTNSNGSQVGQTNGTTNSSLNGVLTTASTSGSTGTITQVGTGVSSDGVANTVTLLQSIATAGVTSNAVSAMFSADQFRLVLSALQQLNDSKIISNPTIVTLNNCEASINVGQQYPIPNYTFNQQTGTFEVAGFTYKDIGINLKVTPQVNARGFIRLTLNPEVSQNNGTTSFGGASGASIPIIATRKASTQVSLKDGYTMGIGGLISSNVNKTSSSVPLLGDIPILGYLFKSTGDTDTADNLLIFITAKTLSAEGAPVQEIFDPRELRDMGLRKSDLPGFRDTSVSPFVDDPDPATLKHQQK